MALTRLTARDIGTVATAINTAVPADKSWTVIGMSLCNKSGVSISVDLYISDVGAQNTYILKNFTIPAGETLFPWGNLGKGVLMTGDVLYVKSSVADSLDVFMPYYVEAA